MRTALTFSARDGPSRLTVYLILIDLGGGSGRAAGIRVTEFVPPESVGPTDANGCTGCAFTTRMAISHQDIPSPRRE
jgi:hypothetical protein